MRHQKKKLTPDVNSRFCVLLNKRTALHVDMRDHFFASDLLGKRLSTQNLEFTSGVSFFF